MTSSDFCIEKGLGKGTFDTEDCFPAKDHSLGGIALGDFNNDGILDAVVPGEKGLWFFPGEKRYIFGPSVVNPLGAFPLAQAVAADLNGDGKLDVVVANEKSMFVVFGNGDGTFQTPVSIPVFSGGSSLSVADLNHDGHPDIIRAVNGLVSVFLNDGSGGFSQSSSLNTSCGPIATGDLNGDGLPDLACDSLGVVYVFQGLGNGSFASPEVYPVEDSQPLSISIASLTASGALDIVVGQFNGMSVLLNNGHGKFTDGTWVKLNGSGDCGATADFNGDGKADLAVIDSQGITILFGTGREHVPFRTGPTIPVSGLGCPTVGDFNGDGIPDLLVGADSLSGVGIYLGNGDGTFRLASVSKDITPCFNIVVGDFNRDGKQDFATSKNQIAYGKGDGTFGPASAITANPPPDCCFYVAAGDVNDDGWPDLLLACGNVFGVEISDQEGGFAQSQVSSPGGTYTLDLVDLNGDGILDVAATTPDGGSSFLGDGQGGFSHVQYVFAPGPDPLAIQVADVNGDGIPDMLLPSDGSIGVAVGNGDGTFQQALAFGGSPGQGRILTMNLQGQPLSSGTPDIVIPDGAGLGVLVLYNRTK